MTHYEACAALGEAVASLGWALLVAPELYLCLCAWWRIQRITDDLEVARDTRDRLKGAIDEPETLLIVETSKEDQPLRFADDAVVRVLKVGPDILSVRAKALFDGSSTIFKGEDALARAEAAFDAAVHRYQRSLEDVSAMTPQQQAARLMRLTYQAGNFEVARALLTFKAEGGDPASAATDEELRAELEGLRAKRDRPP